MKKAIFFGLVFLSMGSIAATTIELSMEIEGTDVYTQKSKTSYSKLYSIASGNVHIKIVDDGQVLANIKQPVNERANSTGRSEIHVMAKDLVRIVDIDASAEVPTNIDELVQAKAKIKSSYIKSIKVKAAEIEAIYQETLTKMGLNQLRGLQLNLEEVQLETDFSMTDMNCSGKKGASLTCKQGISLKINATGN
ncbi:MAG: hypothetical protein HN509_13280 [Halobacteriovoraceae bacterium]|jgi:hypothetical protein|nr:hypothetical protein [Halobacteriovoraceae bacterium]MBT5094401.1 hypothetical protein [Halobacteriovoraceae bacterium]